VENPYIKLGEATLGQVDDSYYYGASCQECHHSQRLSLLRLRSALGEAYKLVDVRSRLKCSACGSRRFIIAYFTPAHRNATLERYFTEPAL
jgi:hypothetical protein